jgi:hypothetical protein
MSLSASKALSAPAKNSVLSIAALEVLEPIDRPGGDRWQELLIASITAELWPLEPPPIQRFGVPKKSTGIAGLP